MCAPNDKVLVPAEWLIGGPAHCEFIGKCLVEEISKMWPSKQRKYRHWWTTADGWIELDACLADEVVWLNGQGVRTFTCCCEHGQGICDRGPWISLHETGPVYSANPGPDHASRALMLQLGYREHCLLPSLQPNRLEKFIFDSRWR